MKKGYIYLTLFLLLGCAASMSVKLPQDLRIVPPAATVPRQVAEFSGKWYGVWDNILDHILVVEEINPPNVIAIYAFGVASQWGIERAGWVRVRGELTDGGLKLSLARPATVIYRMLPDGSLDATYEWRGGISRAKMKRMGE